LSSQSKRGGHREQVFHRDRRLRLPVVGEPLQIRQERERGRGDRRDPALGDRDAGRERSDGLRRRARILQRLGVRSTEVSLVGGLAVLEDEHAGEPRKFPFALASRRAWSRVPAWTTEAARGAAQAMRRGSAQRYRQSKAIPSLRAVPPSISRRGELSRPRHGARTTVRPRAQRGSRSRSPRTPQPTRPCSPRSGRVQSRAEDHRAEHAAAETGERVEAHGRSAQLRRRRRDQARRQGRRLRHHQHRVRSQQSEHHGQCHCADKPTRMPLAPDAAIASRTSGGARCAARPRFRDGRRHRHEVHDGGDGLRAPREPRGLESGGIVRNATIQLREPNSSRQCTA